MSTVRVLSTAELGAIRFAAAESTGKWPTEVHFREGSRNFPFGSESERFYSVRADCSDGCHIDVPLLRTTRAEWRSIIDVPPGSLSYTILEHETEITSGTMEVVPPDPPFARTRLAAQLKSRKSSGAKQFESKEPVSRASPASAVSSELSTVPSALSSSSPSSVTPSEPVADLWRVDFTFAEETWSVRDVWVEPRVGDPVVMSKDDNGVYTTSLSLPKGVCQYRFSVLLRDAAGPDAAPFTRLGWDAAVCTSSSLKTWELSIAVNDLSDGKSEPGESFMDHTKIIQAKENSNLLSNAETRASEGGEETSKKDRPKEPAVTSIVNVRAAAALLDAADSSSSLNLSAKSTKRLSNVQKSPRESRDHEELREKMTENPGISAEHIRRPSRCDSTRPVNSTFRRRTLALLPIIGVACVSIFFALVTRSGSRRGAPVMRLDHRESDPSPFEARTSYYDHARAQGL